MASKHPMERVSHHFRRLAKAVVISLPEQRQNELLEDRLGFVDNITRYALLNLELFGEKLAETIDGVYRFGPGFIQDPFRKGALLLDEDGHIISVLHADISEPEPDHESFETYNPYDVLTGPLAGRSFTQVERPFPHTPEYMPRVISRWFARQPIPSMEAVSINVDSSVLAWFKDRGQNWEHLINSALDKFVQRDETLRVVQQPAMATTIVNINVAPDVLDWFQAKDSNWEQSINFTLKKYVQEHNV